MHSLFRELVNYPYMQLLKRYKGCIQRLELAVLVVHINAQSTTFTLVDSDLEEVWLRLARVCLVLDPI